MKTKHEAVAEALARKLRDVAVPTITRERVLPERIGDDGLLNLVLEDPEEVERRLGVGIREYQRVAEITVVVANGDPALRKAILDERLIEIGAALSSDDAEELIGVDHIDIDAPDYEPDLDMDGSESLSGAVVTALLFYETGDNPLERSYA